MAVYVLIDDTTKEGKEFLEYVKNLKFVKLINKKNALDKSLEQKENNEVYQMDGNDPLSKIRKEWEENSR